MPHDERRRAGVVPQCSVPAPDATVEEDCDAFDIPGQLDCSFFTTCNGTSGGIWFPYCTGLG